MTFDAGAITSSLSVDTSKFDAQLADAKRKLDDLTKDHRVKISAVFDNGDTARARKMFADLDNAISRDAAQRLKSSPQGSVLGSLNSLFSPHPVSGAPTPQMSSQSGLLGRMISEPGGGGPASAAGGQGGVSPLRQVLEGAGPQGNQSGDDYIRQVVTGQGAQNANTTDAIRQVLSGNTPGNVSTEDMIRQVVTGSGPGDTSTTDTVREKTDQSSRDEVIKDATDTGDKAGSGFESMFRKHMSDAGSGGGADLGKGLLGGIGPGISGVSAKMGLMVSGIGTAMAALPALAGVIGLGLGVALVGGAVEAAVKSSPALKAQFTVIGTDAKTMFTDAAKPLIPAVSAVLKQVPSLLKTIGPQLRSVFAAVAPQIQGIFNGLKPVISGVLGIMKAAAPAFGPVLEGLEGLVADLLPGIQVVIKAMIPFLAQFSGILGGLGKNLGKFFSDAAPAIGASMKVLGALLDLIGGLLPVIIKLGGAFATALAPVLATLAGAVKSLLPFFLTLGGVLAELAQAVLGDLGSALTALASLLAGIAPSLNILAKALGQVFSTLENTGVFAELGDAVEALVPPLAKLINALVEGLAPALPGIVGLFAELAAGVTSGLVVIIGGVAEGLTAIVKAIPPPVLGAIVDSLIAFFAAFKTFQIIKSAVLAISAVTKAMIGLDLSMDANPIALVVIAVAALGAGFYLAWQKSAAFRDAIKDIGVVMLQVGIIIVEVNRDIVNAFLEVIATVLRGLADAFGWVPGLGGKLKAASASFDDFKGHVNDAFNGSIASMKGWQKELEAGPAAAASATSIATAKINSDFTSQAAAAAKAQTGIANLTTATSENGYESQKAQAARQQLIADLIGCGVKSGTATTAVDSYSAAVAQNGADSSQAAAARKVLITDILDAGSNAAAGQTELANYTAAVKDNGAKSDAARAARAALIKDLEATGLNAQAANGLVDGLTSSLQGLVKGSPYAVKLKETGAGTFVINGNVAPTPSGGVNYNTAVTKAEGGLITGGSGPTADDVLIRASGGEWVVQASSVAKYGGPAMAAVNAGKAMIAYAAGGAVPGYSGGIGGLAGATATDWYDFQSAVTDAMEKSMTTAFRTAAAAAVAGMKGTAAAYNGPGTLSAQAIMGYWTGAGGPGGQTANIAQAITGPESGRRPGAVQQGQPYGCVPLDTRILTRRGWLAHDQVRPGDQTIGYNPDSGRSEWTLITAVHHYDDAEVWRIGNNRWHADVTPDHRWWSDTETETGTRGEFVRTRDLGAHHRIRLAAPADTDGIPGLFLHECAIIGWLMGDGHVGKGQNHGVPADCWEARIYQSKPGQVIKIRALLAGIPHTERTRQRGPVRMLSHEFRLSRAYANDLLKRAHWGEMTPEEFVLALSPDQRIAWLAAMIDAEGNHIKDTVAERGPSRGARPAPGTFTRISQVDGPMQDAITLAVYLDGWNPSRSPVQPETSRQAHQQPAANIGMRRPHVTAGRSHTVTILGKFAVWCVSTKLGSWTADQDKHVFLTGNSTGWGLWQITPGDSEPQAGINSALLNPHNNAIAAVAKYRGSGGFSPWTTFEDGLYIPYLLGGIQAGLSDPAPSGYAKGGLITEPIIGFGQHTGRSYTFGENGKEWVTPAGGPGPAGSGGVLANNLSIMMPEGASLAAAFTELNFRLKVAQQQGWAGLVTSG